MVVNKARSLHHLSNSEPDDATANPMHLHYFFQLIFCFDFQESFVVIVGVSFFALWHSECSFVDKSKSFLTVQQWEQVVVLYLANIKLFQNMFGLMHSYLEDWIVCNKYFGVLSAMPLLDSPISSNASPLNCLKVTFKTRKDVNCISKHYCAPLAKCELEISVLFQIHWELCDPQLTICNNSNGKISMKTKRHWWKSTIFTAHQLYELEKVFQVPLLLYIESSRELVGKVYLFEVGFRSGYTLGKLSSWSSRR